MTSFPMFSDSLAFLIESRDEWIVRVGLVACQYGNDYDETENVRQ